MKEKIAKQLMEFFKEHGIDPFYAVTIFMIILSVSYWKDIQDWDRKAGWQKGIISTTVVGAVIFSLMSLLRFLGLMNIGSD